VYKAAPQPWHQLPDRVAPVLRGTLDEIADEIIAEVRTVPAYARPLEGAFGRGIRAGVHEALRQFLDEIEADRSVVRGDVYRELGRGELHAGRSLDSLLSAYRVGARVAWRRFAAALTAAGFEPETLYLMAESIFAYIDVLSAESAEGYALEQSALAGEVALRRRRLVRMLVRDPAPELTEIQAAAGEAGWQLPRTLAVLAIDGPQLAKSELRLPADAISESIGEVSCVVVPDPDAPGRLQQLGQGVAAAGMRGALGPAGPWEKAAVSLDRARAALQLAHGSPGLVIATERAGELLLGADRQLASEFASEKLSPLRELPRGSRQRLTETLRVWLAEQGRLSSVAQRLGVHPQTARYRLTRLRELFAGSLDDPDERFWIELALRVERPAAGAEAKAKG
jgi:PucR C-terminal helix-turn-helix domain